MSLFRLYSGHTNTRDHWSRVGSDPDTLDCRYCQAANESAEHIVMHCPALWSRRMGPLNRLSEVQYEAYGRLLTFPELLSERDGVVHDSFIDVVDDLAKRGIVL